MLSLHCTFPGTPQFPLKNLDGWKGFSAGVRIREIIAGQNRQ